MPYGSGDEINSLMQETTLLRNIVIEAVEIIRKTDVDKALELAERAQGKSQCESCEEWVPSKSLKKYFFDDDADGILSFLFCPKCSDAS